MEKGLIKPGSKKHLEMQQQALMDELGKAKNLGDIGVGDIVAVKNKLRGEISHWFISVDMDTDELGVVNLKTGDSMNGFTSMEGIKEFLECRSTEQRIFDQEHFKLNIEIRTMTN